MFEIISSVQTTGTSHSIYANIQVCRLPMCMDSIYANIHQFPWGQSVRFGAWLLPGQGREANDKNWWYLCILYGHIRGYIVKILEVEVYIF
jgi:hypothetical protein